MPATRGVRGARTRATLLVLALALALRARRLRRQGRGEKKGDDKPGSVRERPSANGEPAADPGVRRPQGRRVPPDDRRRSRSPRWPRARQVGCQVRAHQRRRLRRLPARARSPPRPRSPSAGRSASSSASRPTDASPAAPSPTGRPRSSPGRCSPRARPSSSAAPGGCAATWSRAAATSSSRCRPAPRCSPRASREQLRICQTDTGVDISCAQPHAFKVQAVFLAYAASGNVAYPDAADLHRRPPGPGASSSPAPTAASGSRRAGSGWNAGDQFIRCLRPAADADPRPDPARLSRARPPRGRRSG